MEASSLVLGIAVTLLVAYFIPARIAKRYAVVTSREGDRFAWQMDLVQQVQPHTHAPGSPAGSAGKLVRSQVVYRESVSSPQAPSSLPPGSSTLGVAPMKNVEKSPGMSEEAVIEVGAVQQYAALRAKRAARLAREEAAAKRRAVTAGAAGVLLLVVLGLAWGGLISWAWLILPAAFLAGSLASSVMAGKRVAEHSEQETGRLLELREIIIQTKAGGAAKPAEPVGGGRRSARPVRKNAEKAGPFASTDKEAGATQAPKTVTLKAEEADSHSDIADVSVEVEAAEGSVQQPAEEGTSAAPVIQVPQDEERVRPQAGVQWDVPQVPAVRGAQKAQVMRRQVHPDTDIVAVQRAAANVPGRPVRGGAAPLDADVPTTTTSTLRFDLDAVLEQRRAQ